MTNLDYNQAKIDGLFTALNILAIVGETPEIYKAKELIREQIEVLDQAE